MKHALQVAFLLLAALTVAPDTSSAQTAPAAKAKTDTPTSADDQHRKEDIARHRQMARAHEDAAKCMESGEKESVCQSRLQQACKGIAVGKYCGMRHAH